MARHTPAFLLLALGLVAPVASAQVSKGAAQPPGIHHYPPTPKSEAPVRAPESRSNPPYDPKFDRGQRADVVRGDDLFLARPWTYKPRPDRHPRRIRDGWGGGGSVWFGPEVSQVYVPYLEPAPIVEPVVIERIKVVEVEKPAPAPAPVFLPAPPKTLYVIPRCYAGDRLPDPKTLRADCDIADLRTIPPPN